jgi:pimeloyl-ACP methyl ester carboxylesterase
MINWYRALAHYQPGGRVGRRIHVPTLVIWGAQDRFFEPGTAQASIDLCGSGRLVMLESASHWLHHEEPQRVNDLLIDFFGR